MAPKPTGRPHAGNQLVTLANATAAAHATLTAAQIATVAAHIAALEAGRVTKTQRRQERLAAIEARNKNAAGHTLGH